MGFDMISEGCHMGKSLDQWDFIVFLPPNMRKEKCGLRDQNEQTGSKGFLAQFGNI